MMMMMVVSGRPLMVLKRQTADGDGYGGDGGGGGDDDDGDGDGDDDDVGNNFSKSDASFAAAWSG